MKFKATGFSLLLIITFLILVISWSISWVGVFVFGWGFGDAAGNEAFFPYLIFISFLLALPGSVAIWALNLALKYTKGSEGNGDL